jgi:hypothetical protein
VNSSLSTVLAAEKPAGGAALDQVVIATTGALAATAAIGWLCLQYVRTGRGPLAAAARFSERVSGLPGWAALPNGIGAASLLTALLGMYWDIALHINVGRDEGPLANPAHYLILVGLFGVFAAGVIACVLPRHERPASSAVPLLGGWAPVGGLLMAAAGGYALLGFPLDDVWHRVFGQDVTLWGPTHLMLIGGAAMTLIGQALLLSEGMRARVRRDTDAPTPRARRDARGQNVVVWMRRMGIMGGLLIGLSTFQAEYDFGVPQFSLVFQPVLIGLAAGVALVAARIWMGPGGALGAAVFFFVVRGIVALIVGPVFGETIPAQPLYLGEALCVELVALVIAARRRPVVFGTVAGLVAGTVGLMSEWPWIDAVFRFGWTSGLMPEGIVFGALATIAGGAIGALLGAGLRGELPRPAVSRAAFGLAVVTVMAIVANGLITTVPEGVRAQISLRQVSGPPDREAVATVRILPATAAQDANWVATIAWQGGGLVVDRLRRVGDGVFASTEPIPIYGNWKSLVRLHKGRWVLGAPISLPEDTAIPVPAVPARAQVTRPFVDETKILQRELKDDVPPWLWGVAGLLVLAISLSFIGALAWGVNRVARAGDGAPPTRPTKGHGGVAPRPAAATR